MRLLAILQKENVDTEELESGRRDLPARGIRMLRLGLQVAEAGLETGESELAESLPSTESSESKFIGSTGHALVWPPSEIPGDEPVKKYDDATPIMKARRAIIANVP